jgi:hypothetical protein
MRLFDVFGESQQGSRAEGIVNTKQQSLDRSLSVLAKVVRFIDWLALLPSIPIALLAGQYIAGIAYFTIVGFSVSVMVALVASHFYARRGLEGMALLAACLPFIYLLVSLAVAGLWWGNR